MPSDPSQVPAQAAHAAPESSTELAADLTPLGQALGAAEAAQSLRALATLVRVPHPDSPVALGQLLAGYRERLLGPVELPAIRQAYEHVRRGEVRELIELDRRLARQFGGADSAFTTASRHVGRLQLRRLRPMKDRTLQRYLKAVEEGEASGWHVVVYGLLLALFSLPLRQGLSHYSTKTQHGLLDSASADLALPANDRAALRSLCDAPLPALAELVPAGFVPVAV